MGAQTKGNMADPRQRQMVNEGMRRESPLSNQQRPQEQEVGIGNYERQQQERAQQQAMAERMQQQREQGEQRAENTPTPGSGIAFGPGRSNRGDVDLRKLLQDRITSGK